MDWKTILKKLDLMLDCLARNQHYSDRQKEETKEYIRALAVVFKWHISPKDLREMEKENPEYHAVYHRLQTGGWV